MKKALVLLSGGLDSTTTLAIAIRDGFQPYALTFDYGQRHRWELEAARRVAERFDAQQKVFRIDLSQFGGSALTDADIAVPVDRNEQEMQDKIPSTYVPARNTIFLAVALAWAEVLGARDVFIGVNSVDYSGYPDCRPEFIAAFQQLANLATRASVEGDAPLLVHAPLGAMTKREIVSLGLELGVDYSLTSTCYQPSASGKPCGHCDACVLRQRGFEANGMVDPLLSAHQQ